MGIYIKDKELPEGCNVCCFGIWYPNSNNFGCEILEESSVYYRGTGKGRFVDCPLVEVKTPHGRLIDADKAHDVMFNEMCGTGFQGKASYVLESELYTPTVIEGEKGE